MEEKDTNLILSKGIRYLCEFIGQIGASSLYRYSLMAEEDTPIAKQLLKKMIPPIIEEREDLIEVLKKSKVFVSELISGLERERERDKIRKKEECCSKPRGTAE